MGSNKIKKNISKIDSMDILFRIKDIMIHLIKEVKQLNLTLHQPKPVPLEVHPERKSVLGHVWNLSRKKSVTENIYSRVLKKTSFHQYVVIKQVMFRLYISISFAL